MPTALMSRERTQGVNNILRKLVGIYIPGEGLPVDLIFMNVRDPCHIGKDVFSFVFKFVY